MQQVRQVRMLVSIVALALALVPLGAMSRQAAAQEADEGLLVGRVSDVEGQLLRYVEADKDWIATVRDTPFGFEDTLYSGSDGKAELILPNGTWIRIGGSTQIQLLSLKSDVTAVDVASGVVRFYNRSPDAVIKASTPFGSVVAESGSSFDLYVGDESIEVIAIKGEVSYVQDSSGSRFDVTAGSSSIVADAQGAYTGEGNIDSAWDDWNAARDSKWAKRLEVKGESVKYLPEALDDESYALDESGRWEEVTYEGQPRRFWRPTKVRPGWAPFTDGRWSVYHDDQTWVPEEPFGYVTHHYGNWVYINNGWYWAPPAPRPAVGVGVRVAPGLSIGVGVGAVGGGGLSWYPGRVGWIHSGDTVGWVPLAPQEHYYAHHAWGPAATVVAGAGAVALAIGSYRYLDHAVVVPQRNLYRVNNYSSVRVTNINRTTIIKNYRSAPVVNDTVIRNYRSMKDRFNYTNVAVQRKPHQEVLQRIERNRAVAKEVERADAKTIKAAAQKAKPVAAAKAPAKVAPPNVTNKLVKPEDVAKPKAQVQFQKQEVKTKVKPAAESPATRMTLPEKKAGKPAPEGKPGEPARPVPPGKGGKPGEAVSPAPPTKPGEPGRPAPGAQQEKPGKEERPGKAGGPGSEMKPAGPPPQPPGREMKPAVPAAPGQPAPQMKEQPRPGVEPRGQGGPGRPAPEMKPAGPPPAPAGREMKPAGPPAQPPGREMKPAVPAAPGRPAPQMKEQPRPGVEPRVPGGPGRPAPEMKPAGPPPAPAGREMKPAGPPAQPPGREMKPAAPAAPQAAPGSQMKGQPKPPHGPAGPAAPTAPGEKAPGKDKKKPGQEDKTTN